MVSLVAAAMFFLLIHLLVSGTELRAALIARIGQGPYMAAFVAASFGGLVWMGLAFARARGTPVDAVFWDIHPATRHLQLGLMLIAFLFIAPGVTTPNPTVVRQESVVDRPDAAKGMVRITRHPFLWGVAIWAGGHLLVNGNLASLILFGSLLALALLGTRSIDAKRKRALGARWDAFAAQTSNIPFAAIVAGRQSLKLGEIGWWRIALAVAVWAALVGAHPHLFGVRALP